MPGVFVVCTVLGTSLIALWVHARFPARRPRGVGAALAHVVVSFVAMDLGKAAVHLTLGLVPEPYAVVLALVAITVPVLSYVFVSWVWLVSRLRDLGGGPRGGHPVRARG